MISDRHETSQIEEMMASLSEDSDDNIDLSSWTEVDASLKEGETIENDVDSKFEGVAADAAIDEATGVEKLGISETLTSESAGAHDGAATTTTGQQPFQMMAKVFGAMALEVRFWRSPFFKIHIIFGKSDRSSVGRS